MPAVINTRSFLISDFQCCIYFIYGKMKWKTSTLRASRVCPSFFFSSPFILSHLIPLSHRFEHSCVMIIKTFKFNVISIIENLKSKGTTKKNKRILPHRTIRINFWVHLFIFLPLSQIRNEINR